MPSAECHADHRLVRCKLKLQFKPKLKKKSNPMKKLNVGSLCQEEVKAKFQADLQQNLNESPCTDDSNPNILWENLKSAILKTSEEVLGHTKKKNKDWLDENDKEIQDLLSKKMAAHQVHLAQPTCPVKKATFRRACSILQRKLRETQNDCWDYRAMKTQLYADVGDYRGYYEALKAVYGPIRQVQSPLRSSDGQDLLTDNTSILARWSKHFLALFSASRTAQDTAIDRAPQLPLKEELDEPPTLEELTEAIEQLKSRKAAGVDGIPPDIWKHGDPALHDKLLDPLVCCWEQPKDVRDAVIITLCKNKGEKSDCSNYRGITLLAIAGKVLARVLLNRLVPTIAEEILPESHCGFRANRGTMGMVFVLRQLQEKCREQNRGPYATFVGLYKSI